MPEGLALDRIPPLEKPGDGEGDEGQDTGKEGQERGMTIGSRILSQTETATSNWDGWMIWEKEIGAEAPGGFRIRC